MIMPQCVALPPTQPNQYNHISSCNKTIKESTEENPKESEVSEDVALEPQAICRKNPIKFPRDPKLTRNDLSAIFRLSSAVTYGSTPLLRRRKKDIPSEEGVL
jgi:hypothetical protein